MLRELFSYLLLRPHGKKLLTSSAKFWFCSVSVMIIAMASAEAVAWGYLGWLFGNGNTGRMLTAAFAGGLMFIVIWIVDTSLVTLDRAVGEHSTALLGRKSPKRVVAVLRDVLRFGFRIGLIVASLSVTSPYLAQLVFHKDIEAALRVEAVRLLREARDRVTAPFDKKLAGLEDKIEKKIVEHDTEVAGKGRSGRFGEGPASRALLADVGAMKAEENRVRADEATGLAKFDSLAKNWEINRSDLAALYNVTLPVMSIAQNRRVLDQFRQRPENRDTELAIKVFLGIIFSGLMLLKFFEPASVRNYLSEVLQSEYDRYLAGAFDAMLEHYERSTTPKALMTPQRLYEFLSEVWIPAKTQPRTVETLKSLALLENMRAQINSEVMQVTAELAKACDERNDQEKSLSELNTAIETVGVDLEKYRSDLAAAERGLNPTSLDEKGRIENENLLRGKVAKASETLDQLRDSVSTELARREKACEKVRPVDARLKKLHAELQEKEERVQDLREMLAESIGRAASGVLGG